MCHTRSVKVSKPVFNQHLRLIRAGLLIFICSVLLVWPNAYAKEANPSSPQLSHALIGIWQSGVLSLSLKANGELILRQSLVAIKAESNPSLIVKTNHKSSLTTQVYLGYWWSKAQDLCFLLDLSSQCMTYRLHKSEGLKDQAVFLQIKLDQQWTKFIRDSSSQANGSKEIPSKAE